MSRFEAGDYGLTFTVIHQHGSIRAIVTNVELAHGADIFLADALRLHLLAPRVLDTPQDLLQFRHQIFVQTRLHGLFAHESPVCKTHTVS